MHLCTQDKLCKYVHIILQTYFHPKYTYAQKAGEGKSTQSYETLCHKASPDASIHCASSQDLMTNLCSLVFSGVWSKISWNLCGPFGIAGTFLVRRLKRYGGFGVPLKLSNEKNNSALGGDAAHHFLNPPLNNLAQSAFQTHQAS